MPTTSPDLSKAFNQQAVDLLARIQPVLQRTGDEMVQAFYRQLWQQPGATSLLTALSEDELVHLQQQQRQHMDFLLDPHTTSHDIEQRAQRIGYVHALIGVTPSLLFKARTLYRHQLDEVVDRVALDFSTRTLLSKVFDARLEHDLHAQLLSQEVVSARYLNVLSAPLEQGGPILADVLTDELGQLGALPGIVLVLLLRLNSDGIFVVERAAGPQAEVAATLLVQPGLEISVDPQSPNGRGLLAESWRSQQVLSTASYAKDERYQTWRPVAQSVGIRSHLAIPVIDANGHSVWALSLYGAYPHQFELASMRHFAHGIQHRWAQFWRQNHHQNIPVRYDQARAWISRLFDGGLQLYAQPILDIKQGSVKKVELLARLQMPDGKLVAPGLFLPLLGDAELDRLFRRGLALAMRHLADWQAMGYHLQASVNLPPNTLLDPACVNWVAQALAKSSIEPDRLVLELLENQDVVNHAHAISTLVQLKQLGVRVAMDDAGSAYSGLLRMAQMPFDYLKIDQSLVMRLRLDPVPTLGLIYAIIQIGRNFRRQIVAEGVEHMDVLEAVKLLGVDYAQGYGIARPMPVDALPGWLDRLDTPPIVTAPDIQTPLGALAYHWKVMSVGYAGPSLVSACPVQTFLATWSGQGVDQALTWHQLIHETPDERVWQDAHDRLTQWLVEAVAATPVPS